MASVGRRVPRAGLEVLRRPPVRVRGHERGVVRAAPAADRDQRGGPGDRPGARRPLLALLPGAARAATCATCSSSSPSRATSARCSTSTRSSSATATTCSWTTSASPACAGARASSSSGGSRAGGSRVRLARAHALLAVGTGLGLRPARHRDRRCRCATSRSSRARVARRRRVRRHGTLWAGSFVPVAASIARPARWWSGSVAGTESEIAARLIEQLLVDPAFRARFRHDPAAACHEAGLHEVAEEMHLGGGQGDDDARRARVALEPRGRADGGRDGGRGRRTASPSTCCRASRTCRARWATC